MRNDEIDPYEPEGGFVPLFKHLRALGLTHGHERLYGVLASFRGKGEAGFKRPAPKFAQIVERLGIKDERTVRKLLKQLQERGLIAVERNELGHPTRYVFLKHEAVRPGHAAQEKVGEKPRAEEGREAHGRPGRAAPGELGKQPSAEEGREAQSQFSDQEKEILSDQKENRFETAGARLRVLKPVEPELEPGEPWCAPEERMELRAVVRLRFEQRYHRALTFSPSWTQKNMEHCAAIARWLEANHAHAPLPALDRLLDGFFASAKALQSRFPIAFLATNPGEYFAPPGPQRDVTRGFVEPSPKAAFKSTDLDKVFGPRASEAKGGAA